MNTQVDKVFNAANKALGMGRTIAFHDDYKPRVLGEVHNYFDRVKHFNSFKNPLSKRCRSLNPDFHLFIVKEFPFSVSRQVTSSDESRTFFKYYFFRSLDDLLKTLSLIDQFDACLYENIYPDIPIKPYFDIDFKQRDQDPIDVIHEFCEYLIFFFKDKCNVDISTDNIQLYVGDRPHSDSKYSYHIVVNSGHYIHMNDLKSAVLHIKQDPECIFNQIDFNPLDTAPYGSSCQQFRLPLQSKTDSDHRILRSSVPSHNEPANWFVQSFNAPGKNIFPKRIDIIPEHSPKTRSKSHTETHNVEMNCILDSLVNQPINSSFDAKPSHSVRYYLSLLPNNPSIDNYVYWRNIAFACFNENQLDALLEWTQLYDPNYTQNALDELASTWSRGENCFSIQSLRRWAMYLHPESFPSQVSKVDHANQLFYNYNTINWKYDIVNSRYLPPLPHHTKFQNIVLKSPMGTGKSTVLGNWLEPQADKSMLLVVSRILFGYSIQSDLNQHEGINFQNYKGLAQKDLNKANHLVCSVESLCRIGNRKFDIIILDESESVLKQLSAFKTHRERWSDNIKTFDRICKKASNIFIADAFLTSRSIDFFKSYTNNNTLFIQNEWRDTERSMNFYRDGIQIKRDLGGERKHKFTNHLMMDITRGKNICLISSSKRFIDTVHERINKRFKSNVPCLIHTSDSCDQTNKDALSNVNENWSQFQFVAYSPSITIGVNFSIEHFDSIYVYDCGTGICVRDVYQMMMRVRKPKSPAFQVYIAPSWRKTTDRISFDEVKQEFVANNDYSTEELNTLINLDFRFNDLPSDIQNLLVLNEMEDRLSEYDRDGMFDFYRKECGFGASFVDPESDTDTVDDIDDEIDLVDDEDYWSNLDISTIHEARQRYECGTASEYDKHVICKYYFSKCFKNLTFDYPIFKRFYLSSPQRELFKNISFFVQMVNSPTDEVTQSLIEREFDEQSAIKLNHRVKQMLELREIMKSLNVTDITQEKVIMQNDVMQIPNERFILLDSIFQLRDQRSNKTSVFDYRARVQKIKNYFRSYFDIRDIKETGVKVWDEKKIQRNGERKKHLVYKPDSLISTLVNSLEA